MTNTAAIYTGLSEIFADVFMRDDITLRPDMTSGDIEGWDSFKQIEIIMAAEERFDVKFSSSELDDIPCLDTLAGLIQRKCQHR